MNNGTVNLKTLRHDFLARIAMVIDAQRSGTSVMVVGSREPPRVIRQRAQRRAEVNLPIDLPFRFIVVGSSINPGCPYQYETDTLLTDADVERMTLQENLRVTKDKSPWAW